MFTKSVYEGTREQNYVLLIQQVEALMHDEPNRIANLANAAALLGVRIPLGKGVCGTSAERQETMLVPDVHVFPGHIACDAASQSEIVVPILRGTELIGVLDIDSPIKSRFDEIDQHYLEQFVEKLAAAM